MSKRGRVPVSQVARMQYYATDVLNQTADSATYSLVPIIFRDPVMNTSPLTLAPGAVWDVAFSRDGHRLVSVDYGGMVRLWPMDASPETLCAKLTTNMSRQEWRDWVSPNIPYRPVCPGLPTPAAA